MIPSAAKAVVCDMDGVLTDTAAVHQAAWKETFDALLSRYPEQRPFSEHDYRLHVDGKPRHSGIVDFLKSRGIELAQGTPSDGVEQDTVQGIGARKNKRFLGLLESRGVTVFDEVKPALTRWRNDGLKIAIVSSSRNCKHVLTAAKLVDAADEIVDGETAAQLELPGKRSIMEEAARRLEFAPQEAVVFEDASAGVRAAREAGFGWVVGVDRTGHGDELSEAGAHQVVRRLDDAPLEQPGRK